MTVLVTGAAGFLGRHVLQKLLADGQSVRALVRTAEQGEPLRKLGASVALGDIRDRTAVEAATSGAEVVYHCAAAVGAHYSAEEVYAINLGGARNVLDALRQANRGRLVLVSSVNVLGIRNYEKANEDLPCRRESESHADVKIDAEQAALDYHRQYGVDVVIVRPALIYGPGEKNIPKLVDTIRRGKFAFIGSRENVIPMVHVTDIVAALQLAASVQAASGRIYHITDGARTTAGMFIDYLAELIHCPTPQKVLPYFIPYAACLAFEWLNRLHLVHKAGPINRIGLRFLGTSRDVDISRAVRELHYQPKIAFRAGMAETVRSIEQQSGSSSHDQAR
ncbi:MAG: NAD-dependent epimerase/dehydratase family protein [Thermoguttaceae bacterium]|jgi:nucleoside-diphosphate-sugar epimerase